MKIKELIHTLYLLAFLLPLFAMGGCIREDLSGGDVADGKQIELGIRLVSRSTDPEDVVEKVRIIVFDAKGLVAFNKLYDNIEPEYRVNLHTGVSYTLAAICNETAALTTALSSISGKKDLETTRLAYTAAPTPPFVFFGEMKGVDVHKGNSGDDSGTVSYPGASGTAVTGDIVPISIKRLVSKVTLSLIRDVPAVSAGGTQFSISNLKYKVMQIPTYSTLSAPQAYVVDEGWLPELTASNTTVTLTGNNTATWNSADKKHTFDQPNQVVTFPSFYLPEHILAISDDDANCTYILISGTCKLDNGATVEGNWRINPGKNKNLERNTHYHIVGKIQGLGGIGIYADIVEVEENKITVDWRPLEGLVIVGDRVEDYNNNTNVWNVRNTYSGILKVVKNKTYHDVLFKYGSLLAVEAKSGDAFSADDILWKPSTYTTSATINWDDIPYLNNVPDNTETNVAAALGDPCKLAMLSDDKIKEGIVDNVQWHMATSEELQRLIKAKDDAKQGYADNADGFQSYSSLLIPNTYSRDNTGQNTTDKLTGSYWSSNDGNAFSFTGAGNVDPKIATMNRDAAYTVRCVRNSKDVVVSWINPINVHYVDWPGGERIVEVKSNIPYWEIKCLDSDGKKDSMSFVGGIYYGNNSGNIVVKLDRWVTPHNRSFNFQITGYGYDGKTITQDFTIDQVRYYWAFAGADFTRLDPKPTEQIDGHYILSADAATYKVHIQVYPDVPSDGPVPSDIPLPLDAQVKLQFLINTSEVIAYTELVQLEGSRQRYVDITIPANTSGSMRGVYIQILGQGTIGADGIPGTAGNFAPSPTNSYYLQDYKR